MIDSTFESEISLQDIETSMRHDLRWWIDIELRLPELPSSQIVSCHIEIERALISSVWTTIDRIIAYIRDKLIDRDRVIFAFHGDSIELPEEIGLLRERVCTI